DLRAVLNAILYLVRTGCQWRLLPHDFPPWSTLHTWYRRWRQDGTLDKVHQALRQQVRRRADRHIRPRPSAADRQSVNTAHQGGDRGFDNGKKVKGRKRHLWVDSMGLLLAVLVTAADVHDSRAACDLLHSLAWEELPRLEVVYTDSHYTARYLDEAVFSWSPFRRVVISRPQDAVGFVRLPKRWVVERTFAWLGRSRRLSKDCEKRTDTSAAMIRIAMIHLMVHRLASDTPTQEFAYKTEGSLGAFGTASKSAVELHSP